MKRGNEACALADRPPWSVDQRQALTDTRWIWSLAWLPFLAPLGRMIFAPAQPDESGYAREQWLEVSIAILYWAAVAGWMVLVPLAYFVRNQTYKSHWRGDAVSPTGYEKGNVNLFLILEVPCILGFLAYELTADPADLVLPLTVTAVFLLVNFPTGKPMRPTAPRLGVSERRDD